MVSSGAERLEISSKKLLLVEGKDEENFFQALLSIMAYDNKIQVIGVSGKGNFSSKFNTLVKAPNFSDVESIGFVRDADNNAKSAFESICSVLRTKNYVAPISSGLYSNGNPRIGVFIMPDNKSCGMLEDLCLQSIKNLPINDCISDFIGCIPNKDKSFESSKSKVQIYLSSKTPIVNNLGLGAQKKYWDFDNPCFNEIKEFIKNLTV